MPVNCRCSIGSQLGWIMMDYDGYYALRRCTVNKIVTNSTGSKYYSPGLYKPASSKAVDPNTDWMESTPEIKLDAVFVITDITRAKAEKWVKWANKDPWLVRENDAYTMGAIEDDADEAEDT